jgi:glycosyltransferase involved in cell wall biosynthesis
LLKSIARQTYLKTRRPEIILADAGSADDTARAAHNAAWLYGLRLTCTHGGLPAVGRNVGARLAKTRYLLFLDADVQLEDPEFVETAINTMRAKGLHCVTTDIHCPTGKWRSKLAYFVNNIYQRISRFGGTPFATGMCMFFDRKMFEQLGGFNEKALFAEDYMLSKQVNWKRFRVIRGGVATSDRRMAKMGYWGLAKLFLYTAAFSHRESTFTKDHGYWKS